MCANEYSTLDLSRRRVAAISFLANISTDEKVNEIRLDCLQGTHVLKDFQRNKLQRLNHHSAAPTKPSDVTIKLDESDEAVEMTYDHRPSLTNADKIPRKLTFVTSAENQQLFIEECEDDEMSPQRMMEPPPSPRPMGDHQSHSQENLLHLDLSKMLDVQRQLNTPKSAPMPNTNNLLPLTSNKNSFNFATSDSRLGHGSSEGSSIELKSLGKRKLTLHCKSDDARTSHGGSHESLTIGSLAGRSRKVSGNVSENSSVSLREVRYFRADEEKNVGEERLVLVSTENKIPFAVVSTIPYTKSSRIAHRRHSISRLSFRGDRDLTKRIRTNSGTRPLSAITDTFDPLDIIGADRPDDGQETSYGYLLNPTYKTDGEPIESSFGNYLQMPHRLATRHVSSDMKSGVQHKSDDASRNVVGGGYSARDLDGWLIAGKHRTFLPFSSYVTSVIEYVKPSDMKKELNLKFKEKFPNVHLSLSKLRSLKREMFRIALDECGLDLLTVALSYVYFEMLVLKNAINKINRKYCAAACLILAAKLNDVKGASLACLIEKSESVFRLNRKDLLTSEFAVLVALEFALHVPSWQVFPHYQRLMYQVK